MGCFIMMMMAKHPFIKLHTLQRPLFLVCLIKDWSVRRMIWHKGIHLFIYLQLEKRRYEQKRVNYM